MRAPWLLAAMISTPASAAEGADFCSDRPGLSTGSCTAAPGTFQLETSLVEWSTSRADGIRLDEWAIGSTRLRYGIGEATDLHLALAPLVLTREHGPGGTDTQSGAGDVSLAVKHRLTPDSAAIAVAVMPFVKVPTASKAIGNGRWEGGILVPIDAGLSGPWSLTLTPEVDWNADAEGDGRHARLAIAATLGVELGPRWAASIDGMVGRERDGGETIREAAASVSVAFLARPAMQLDVQADVGLARDTPDARLTTGIAFRF